MGKVSDTLLLEKVQPSKVQELEKHYRLEFKTPNEDIVYTVFIEKEYFNKKKWILDDTYDVIRVDIFRSSIEKDFVEDLFAVEDFLEYQGIYSFIRIEPNHTDPAKFNRIG